MSSNETEQQKTEPNEVRPRAFSKPLSRPIGRLPRETKSDKKPVANTQEAKEDTESKEVKPQTFSKPLSEGPLSGENSVANIPEANDCVAKETEPKEPYNPGRAIH